MSEFYDGQVRPLLSDISWKKEDMIRICYNCGQRFGQHHGYICFV